MGRCAEVRLVLIPAGKRLIISEPVRPDRTRDERLHWGRLLNGDCWRKFRPSCQAGFGMRHRPRSWPVVGGFLPLLLNQKRKEARSR